MGFMLGPAGRVALCLLAVTAVAATTTGSAPAGVTEPARKHGSPTAAGDVATPTAPPSPTGDARATTTTQPPVSESASPTGPIPSAAPVDGGGAGFGATDAEWSRWHVADRSKPAGAAYDPDPRLPADGGSIGSRYTNVVHQAGRVLGYTMTMDPGTDLATSVAAILAELPPDTVTVWSARGEGCFLRQLRSPTLARLLGALAPHGGVLVEYEPRDPEHTTADEITAATVMASWQSTVPAMVTCGRGGAG